MVRVCVRVCVAVMVSITATIHYTFPCLCLCVQSAWILLAFPFGTVRNQSLSLYHTFRCIQYLCTAKSKHTTVATVQWQRQIARIVLQTYKMYRMFDLA